MIKIDLTGFLALIGFLLFGMYLVIETQSEKVFLQNGQNFYCPNEGYMDIIKTNEPEVRFSCSDPSFEVTFSIPNNPDLVSVIRESSQDDGFGVIVSDGALIQFYDTSGIYFNSRWDVSEDK